MSEPIDPPIDTPNGGLAGPDPWRDINLFDFRIFTVWNHR